MKFKLAGFTSTVLLLLTPITGALTAVSNTKTVYADNNWDYDVDNPSLSSYDQLLQNAGPTDGIVDWYPTKGALSNDPSAQEVVKQLIDLSISTNDSNSNARKVLFNDTTGNLNDIRSDYKSTYDKYSTALGFIAQIINLNNTKTGLGVKLEQHAVKSANDKDDPADTDGNNVITDKVQLDPKDEASKIGKNISDVLGASFFGNADDAYAQIYLNGYDNVSQNESNIIREGTSSITLVAFSKTTGKKATAVFKLNNKTLPQAPTNSKLNNYVDNSLYALEKDNGKRDIAGLNLATAPKSVIDNLKLSKKSTFWVDGNGDGTIVVPRGTTAKQIADLIAKKKLDSNNSLKETAPMKAIQSTDGAHGYEHKSVDSGNGNFTPFNGSSLIKHSMKGPDKGNTGYIEYSNNFLESNKWFGGANDAEHMLDTNSMLETSFSNKSASEIPNSNVSESSPFINDPEAFKPQDYIKPNNISDVQNAAVVKTKDGKSNVGKVGHLFQPAGYVKESYDANHFVNDNPEFKDSDSSKIAQSIANSGSFSSTDPNAGVKKSFTYEAPVNTWMYKSFNNPYSTVVSSQGSNYSNSKSNTNVYGDTIKPQEYVDLADPNNDKPNLSAPTTLKLDKGNAQVIYTGKDKTGDNDVYYYIGVYNNLKKLTIPIPSATTNIEDSDTGALTKYGTVGTDGSEPIMWDPKIYKNSPDPFGTTSVLNSEFNNGTASINFGDGNVNKDRDKLLFPYVKKKVSKNQSMFFVQTWDKNVDSNTNEPKPLIYNAKGGSNSSDSDSPNFESKYYIEGVIEVDPNAVIDPIKAHAVNVHAVQDSDTKKAFFNSNLYNYDKSEFAKPGSDHQNNSQFFVSQDFSVGPVSSDMVSRTGDSSVDSDPSKIIDMVAKNSDPSKNEKNNYNNDVAPAEFTVENGYKLVTLDDAAKNQNVSVDALASEVSKVTGKSLDTVKNTKWLEASLPRLKENAGTARVNVVVYDKEAVSAPTKQDTKPSFSVTDLSNGNDPFNVSLRPYTTTYDDGAVLTTANVPQNFKNLVSKTLVAGNPDFVDASGKVSNNKLQQVLVSSFLSSWQQNDGSFKQTDSGLGVRSPLYMYGGFGISNSDSKNSYTQWPLGYSDNSGDYKNAVNSFSGDFYRGGTDLKAADGKNLIKGIPFNALTADVSKVDITKPGTYPVVYTYTNPDNAKDTASITVPVTVSEVSKPIFAFQGSADSTINVDDSFNENEYKVVGSWAIFNNYGGDYSKLPNFEGIAKNNDGSPKVTITGHVDTHTPGIYQLTYEATSISGETTTMIRKITVLPKSIATDWTITDMKAVGYINYVPNYGIMVFNAPAGSATGQRLAHTTAWRISQKAVNAKGDVFYRVGKNQWINGRYVSFSPISTMAPLKGEIEIVYVRGYGVNIWKSAGTTNSYYMDRKLKHGSKWKTFGLQNGFYKVGRDQWVQGDFARYKAYK